MWQIIAIEFAVPKVFFRAVYPLGAKKKKSAFVLWGFPGGSDGKGSACSAGDPGLIPGQGRSSGEGHGNTDGGAWRAAESQTGLSDQGFGSMSISPLLLCF